MSVPFYVSPEQQMRDRADFARKGIAKGRSAIAVQYADGILLIAENRSPALHKVAEIYDRIAFAAVGRYNEFENLRLAGVRIADMRGYAYDRRDVTGRALANAYAQTLGSIFSSGAEKPFEVEIIVAEVGSTPDGDQIYRLMYDGSIADERGFAAMGGSVEQVGDYLTEHYREGMSLSGALRLAVDALGHDGSEVRQVAPNQIEVGVLDRTRTRQRKFRRIPAQTVERILSESTPDTAPASPKPDDTTAADPATGPDTAGSGAADPATADSGTESSASPDSGSAGSGDEAPVAPPEEPADR